MGQDRLIDDLSDDDLRELLNSDEFKQLQQDSLKNIQEIALSIFYNEGVDFSQILQLIRANFSQIGQRIGKLPLERIRQVKRKHGIQDYGELPVVELLREVSIFEAEQAELENRQKEEFFSLLDEFIKSYKQKLSTETTSKQAGSATKKRKRNPSASILVLCKDAMSEWLDLDKSLTLACETHGVQTKTVRRWIPNVLEIIESEKREDWTRKLKALKELT